MDGFRKRATDYTDVAYREAVSKLRYLLAESYTPSTTFSKYSLGHYHPFLPGDTTLSSPRPAIVLTKPPEPENKPPPELMSFVHRQEEYIEQLEKESQFCRDELSNLMGKVREVITENEGLRERRKSAVLQSLFDSFEMEEDEDDEDASSEDKVESQPSKKKHLIGPSIVFESRISELEAQLTQTKMDLKKAVDEAESLRRKLAEQGLNTHMSDIPQMTDSELYRQIEALQREREELNDMVNKLHASVAQLREKEASAAQKLKRSLDAVDQAMFEKNQSEMEVRRLKNELDRMGEKQRESVGEQSRRLAEVERRYTAQTEQLSADLSAQWESSTKLSLDLEKQRRTETELRRELAQRNATLEELKKELNTKTSALQSELLASSGERDSMQQEVSSLRLAVERAERTARQDTTRLQAEVTSLRQRLDRADTDLLHARKENLRLTEQISSLEKELHLAKLTHESGENEILKDSKREKELTSMILDMDAKHVQNISDLEGMIQSQSQLMEKLKDECHTLTQKLEDTSMRHKRRRRQGQVS